MKSKTTTAAGPASPLTSEAQSSNVVVVDSDPHTVDYLRFFLQEAGYSVASATPGADALDAVRRARPRLTIAEILTPRLDGFSLCRELKSSPETTDVRVILFSFFAASERAREVGADAFLMKPVSESRLLETVREVLADNE